MTQTTKKQQVSQELMPKKIREGEIKIFRLIGAGAIDPLTDLPSFNAGATLEGRTTIYDRGANGGTGATVILKNITGQTFRMKDGIEETVEIISPISFDSYGLVRVSHKEPETYIFLCRDDRCATNPFRNKDVPAMWEEILPVNIKEKEQIKINLDFDAMSIVMRSEGKELKAIAETLAKREICKHININGPLPDIKYELQRFAKTNPKEIIRAAKDKMAITKLDIQDAATIGEIEYYNDGNSWVWAKIEGDTKKIYQVTPGEDPVEALAKYLLKEEEENSKAKPEERKITSLKKLKESLKELSVEV